ncbi:hypothetical protein CRV01_09215 [Arcobacter sp. CECT 8983]|uniref:hypothetical protein n=1 Tax=Arcobacter sp. CECT 8983 TaxID=2044508 RepID=UPI00100ABCA8|nr:hypothetical protein [Arcobacter sp. CECT 8983]RXJ88794.1 hypothetical protein CRV01_09215 [Arcobacter sp. CECT 8983]
MAKITLDIDEKNLKTVMHILDNLKDGLINNISTNRQYKTAKPISSSIDRSAKTSSSSNKYLSPSEFKKRLQGN